MSCLNWNKNRCQSIFIDNPRRTLSFPKEFFCEENLIYKRWSPGNVTRRLVAGWFGKLENVVGANGFAVGSGRRQIQEWGPTVVGKC